MIKNTLKDSLQKSIELIDVNLTLKGPSGNVNILHNISLSICEGSSVAIVGPSGSGKTSLLMVMSGIERVTSGNILVNGEDISSMDEDQLSVYRRDNIGIVFQSFHLIPTMTALENIMIPLDFAKIENSYTVANEVINNVGLSHRSHHYPSQLSGGEQQRIALARSFAVRPKILLADEPTGNLDNENSKHIIKLLFSLNKQNMSTLLLVTHNSEIAKHCDRIITIEDGHVLNDLKS